MNNHSVSKAILAGLDEEYEAFFKKKLEAYGVSSPSELKEEEKKKFFNEIEKEWKEGQGPVKAKTVFDLYRSLEAEAQEAEPVEAEDEEEPEEEEEEEEASFADRLDVVADVLSKLAVPTPSLEKVELAASLVASSTEVEASAVALDEVIEALAEADLPAPVMLALEEAAEFLNDAVSSKAVSSARDGSLIPFLVIVKKELRGPARGVSMEYRTKTYGKPNDKNLAKYVQKFNESLGKGGVNSHIGPKAYILEAEILNQKTGQTVARYKDRNPPMFVASKIEKVEARTSRYAIMMLGDRAGEAEKLGVVPGPDIKRAAQQAVKLVVSPDWDLTAPGQRPRVKIGQRANKRGQEMDVAEIALGPYTHLMVVPDEAAKAFRPVQIRSPMHAGVLKAELLTGAASTSQVLNWMKKNHKEHIDRKTGELDLTGLAEAAANEFDVYKNTRDYEIPEWVFEASHKVGEKLGLLASISAAGKRMTKSERIKMQRAAKKRGTKMGKKFWVEVTNQPVKKRGGTYVGTATFHWQKDRDKKKHSVNINVGQNKARLKVKSRQLMVKPQGGEEYVYGQKAENKKAGGSDSENEKGKPSEKDQKSMDHMAKYLKFATENPALADDKMLETVRKGVERAEKKHGADSAKDLKKALEEADKKMSNPSNVSEEDMARSAPVKSLEKMIENKDPAAKDALAELTKDLDKRLGPGSKLAKELAEKLAK